MLVAHIRLLTAVRLSPLGIAAATPFERVAGVKGACWVPLVATQNVKYDCLRKLGAPQFCAAVA